MPVNVNFRYVEEELRYLFDNADFKAVVYDKEFAPRIRRFGTPCRSSST